MCLVVDQQKGCMGKRPQISQALFGERYTEKSPF